MKNSKVCLSDIESEISKIGGVQDGIINLKLYNEAPFKILWVLKEAYNPKPTEGSGDGWDFREIISSKKSIDCFEGAVKMYSNMTCVSWGLFNNFRIWKEIPEVKEVPNMLFALKSTAYMRL